MRKALFRLSLLFVAFYLAASMLFLLRRDHDAPQSPPILATTTAARSAEAITPDTEGYPVVRVVDGDTIKIRKDGGAATIRLIGIDTPEVVDPRKPVQCFGKEASNRAHALLDGERVRLEFDPSQGRYDKYGRTLAYVFLLDGTFINYTMIAEGYAHEYTYRFPYAYQEKFKAAEKAAREERRGLWAPETCNGATGTRARRGANTVY